MQEVIVPLLAENADNVGDLYLDVAEALMVTGHNREAEPILAQLVTSSVYNLVRNVTSLHLSAFPFECYQHTTCVVNLKQHVL